MTHKVGDKLFVKAVHTKHGFPIGTEVIVKKEFPQDNPPTYLVANGKTEFFLNDTELSITKP